MVGRLSEAQRADVLRALQAIIDERVVGSGPPEISLALNIAVGTKPQS